MPFTAKTIKVAKFNIGDQVVHQHQGYRGIIIDIDPLFQASGRYNPQAYKFWSIIARKLRMSKSPY